MTRARAATTVALGVAVLVGVAALARVWLAPPAPNVVLVLVDALRRDHVGAYGYPLPTTPFLDSLAQRGVVFDHAWMHAPQTFNSTAALLAAQLFPRLGVRQPGVDADGAQLPLVRVLADDNLVLPELLQDAGYDTLAVFTNPHHAEEGGFTQGFRVWRYLAPATGGAAFATAADVNRTFRELAPQLDASRPFFAYVHYMDVHNPYLPPADAAALFVETQGTDRYMNGRPEGEQVPSADDLRFMIESYDAGIRHTDDSLRDLAAAIAASSHGRETVLIVTADHGDEFMDHGGLGHGHAMHQELLQVPLIATGGALPHGVRVRRLVRGIDVAPTVADLAQAPAAPSFEGRSLLPLIASAAEESTDERPAGPRAARLRLATDEHSYSFGWNGHLRSLTTDDFHLVEDRVLGEHTLYEVRHGAQGRQDLFAKSPRVVRLMRRKMRELELRLAESHQRLVRLDEETDAERANRKRMAAQLRALGYAQ